MRSVKLEEGDVDSSRCCDQVFGSRVTTSALAGEYVTARGYVGGRASFGKLWDEYFLYKTRAKGEAMVDDVRVVEEGAADYGARGRYDPPKLWISLFSFVFLLFVSGQGWMSTRALGG